MLVILALFALGLVVLVLQGALATLLPPALCPDFVLLLVIAMALRLGGARALLASAALGYAGDILAGSPLGLQALLRVLAFGAARAANRSLELRTALAQATLAAVLTLLQAVALVAISWALDGSIVLEPRALLWLGSQTLLDALFAPSIGAFVGAVASRTLDEEGPRRQVALGSGRRAP